MNQVRVLNWRPDLPDQRDKLFSVQIPASPKLILPPSVDLRPLCSPVVDQGRVGSCTGNALAASLEFLGLMQDRLHIDPSKAPEEFDPKSFDPISRLFIYFNERAMEGTTSQDAGASIRDGVLSLKNTGFCRESVWPYIEEQLYTKPSAEAYQEAARHKVLAYYRLSNLDDMKRCLSHGYPFVGGISVYASFMSQSVGRNGIVPMPGYNEELLGGHAINFVGYDDNTRLICFKNSWGTSWGDQGFGFLSYDYMSPYLASDFWTLR